MTTQTAPPADTSQSSSDPILDFDELAPTRDTIRHGGKLYELRRMDDFGISKQQELQRDGREFSRLWGSDDELTEKQQQRLKMLLERMFAQVLQDPRGRDLPKTVIGKFTDAQKSQVVLTFTLAPLKQLMATTGQTDMEGGVGSITAT